MTQSCALSVLQDLLRYHYFYEPLPDDAIALIETSLKAHGAWFPDPQMEEPDWLQNATCDIPMSDMSDAD